MSNPVVDCVVIGGGPAGLTAAIYLARFRLSVIIIDEGNSRASLIPLTRNHAGFPEGIVGVDLVNRMRDQALRYGAIISSGRVFSLEREGGGFAAETEQTRTLARCVLLATGVTNRRPAMSDSVHDQALLSGRLRYCPVCDGYEITDKAVAVIGTGVRGVKEAEFLRSYTRRITLVPNTGRHDLSMEQRLRLSQGGITILEDAPEEFRLESESAIDLAIGDSSYRFDSIYPALGSEIHSTLARELGADLTEEGCIKVDTHQRTSREGVYAAGDVVVGLDQISHAMGEGGVAATTMRNDLANIASLRR